jgi:hypothetical protein
MLPIMQSIETILFYSMTQSSLPLKLTIIDPSKDQPHYFTYQSQSGVSSTKQFAMQHLYWYGGQCTFGMNHQKHYTTICAHEYYCSQLTCQPRSCIHF